MILPALVALPAALGLLLRGSWDVWAQTLIHVATAGGTTLWLLSRIAVGYVPLPSRRNLAWTAGLVLLGSASVLTSPVRGLGFSEWYIFLNALWIFPVITAVSKDERIQIDHAIRAAAWVLMVLAFYQRISLGEARPSSALVNPNIYAGTILLLLPLSLERRDWLLAAGLIINLWWTRSVGAWLGIFAALLITRRWRHGVGAWAGALGGLVCLIAIYGKFQSPEVLHRLGWWQSAAAMVFDRPLSGAGPGSFAYVLHAYRSGGGLSTLYAHQYFFQTAAEYGLLFSIVWFSGLWSCVLRGNSYKRFGALAVLIHSCWDWTLSMPANLWLFSYFAASSLSTEAQGVNIRARWKIPAAVLIASLGWFVCRGALNLWSAERSRSAALAAVAAEDHAAAETAARETLARNPRDARAVLILVTVDLGRAASAKDPEPSLRSAAAHLERAAELNPYRAWTWTRLAEVYRKIGDEKGAAAALERGAVYCVRLRKEPPR